MPETSHRDVLAASPPRGGVIAGARVKLFPGEAGAAGGDAGVGLEFLEEPLRV